MKAIKAVRILFLHPNFPAQFRHPAQHFADKGHDVVFMCQTHYGRHIPSVTRLCLKGKVGHQNLVDQNLGQRDRCQAMGKQYRQGMLELVKTGWIPDVVISHSGWGCGYYVKEFWPHCKHLTYLEWWFAPDSALLKHDPKNKELGLSTSASKKLWERNQTVAVELACSDVVIAPSRWQRSQLPKIFQQYCQVIYDGVDKSIFKPDPSKKRNYPVLTYGTRGMEPMRSFPEFIRELPYALREWPELVVEVAGVDEINYGGQRPEEGSWGLWANKVMAEWIDKRRFKWLGRLESEDYVTWLQSSWCHVYLTQPFVASWSLVESLSCGCQLIASDVPPVREFCNEDNSTLVDSRKPGFLQAPLATLKRYGSLKKTPDLVALSNPRLCTVEEAMSKWSSACLG